MTFRIAFAAALAGAALAAPAAGAAPDASQLVLAPTDLPPGASVVADYSYPLGGGARESDRYFELPSSSGFAVLESSVILTKNVRDAKLVLLGARVTMSGTSATRRVAKLIAGNLGVKVRRLRVGKPHSLTVGDGRGFTVSIRVNRKTPIVAGAFRVGRAYAEIDARAAHGAKGFLSRTRSVMRVAADRLRAGLLPQSLAAPAIAGTAQVGAVLQAAPGTWSEADTVSYAWQRCDAAGACAPIAGATQSTYTVTAADSGATLEVVVTAANPVGQTSVASAPTAPVP
jgi:hypothetical protein